MPVDIISRHVRIGLKAIGVWPGWSSSVGFFLVVGSLVLCLTFQLWHTILVFRNLDALMANLGATTAVLAAILKLISLHLRRRGTFFNCIASNVAGMVQERSFCHINGHFDIFITSLERNVWKGSFVPKKVVINEMYKDWSSESKRIDNEVMPRYMRRACILTRWLIVAYNSIIVTYSLNAIMAYTSGIPEKRVYVIPAKFPTACKHSPLFEVVCLCQFVAAFISINGHVMVEGLLVTLVLHAGTKVNIMQREIGEFSEVCRSSKSSKLTLEAVRGFLKTHLNYIDFVERIKDIYAYVSFFHVFTFTLMHVIVGYMFIDTLERGERSIKLFLYGLFTVRTLLSTMIHCVAGEYLMNQSKKVFEDLCNCNWYEFHLKDMKAMTFIIMRSRSPMCLVTAKVNQLSLNYLTSIIRTSFSFLSLARAVRYKIN